MAISFCSAAKSVQNVCPFGIYIICCAYLGDCHHGNFVLQKCSNGHVSTLLLLYLAP